MLGYTSLTSSLMWRTAAVAALLDAPIVALLAWRVSAELFRQLKWYLVGAAFLVFAGIWGVFGSFLYWDEVYSSVFPVWFHWLLPVIYGSLYALLALGFWVLSQRAARWQVLWFILLGGVVSLVGHTIGISRGLFNVPMLAQTSVASALTFGVFEFIFYFCIIVALASTAHRLFRKLEQCPALRLKS